MADGEMGTLEGLCVTSGSLLGSRLDFFNLSLVPTPGWWASVFLCEMRTWSPPRPHSAVMGQTRASYFGLPNKGERGRRRTFHHILNLSLYLCLYLVIEECIIFLS